MKTESSFNLQEKAIELTDRFIKYCPEVTGDKREKLCSMFSEAIEYGTNSKKNNKFSDKMENLNISFLELVLSDEETALEVLKEEGIDIEKVKKSMLEKIEVLKGEVE